MLNFDICFPLDLGDFLTEEIKGPASFSCKSGGGCQFEEPAMNVLITQVFGDGYITLECDGGECLHYSQVPGYVVSTNRIVSAFSFCMLTCLAMDV